MPHTEFFLANNKHSIIVKQGQKAIELDTTCIPFGLTYNQWWIDYHIEDCCSIPWDQAKNLYGDLEQVRAEEIFINIRTELMNFVWIALIFGAVLLASLFEHGSTA